MTHDCVLRLTVPGEPLPKQRARTVQRHGLVMTYTPTRTRAHERMIAMLAAAQRVHLQAGPLALTLRFHRATGRTADLDNLTKTVKDALNGVAWKDDRQVVQLHAVRIDRDPNPRTEIVVHRIEA